MNPRDYKTWTSFEDHPIFSDRKHEIEEWSSDPTRYCKLNYYSTFHVDWYVHVFPQLPSDVQAEYAARDIQNLAEACAAIEKEFGDIRYELLILDDLTVYVWIVSSKFEIDLYPTPYDGSILFLGIEHPGIDETEHFLNEVAQLVPLLLKEFT